MQPPTSPAPDDWNKHWTTYADTAALNPAQNYRRQLIFERLKLDAAGAPCRVLELGSGQGDLSQEIHARYPEVELCGLDISESGLELARQKVPTGTFLFQDFGQPLTILDKYQAWATHAVCSEVLEHVDEPVVVLRNVRACLAPGARLVITVPAGPMSAFDRYIGHRRHFTPKLLADLVAQAGLELETLNGAGFPFFNLYRLVVVARGKKLIHDVANTGPLPASAQAAMRAFDFLFRWNSASTQRGWQLVASVREPSRRP
jgi:2-polyprenyl-3-methyl-5-hydroxy-6-metoxy-1,4-benzoquinol methylase